MAKTPTDPLKIKKFVGEEIRGIQTPLAELRIQVFYDFPYLYEGSLAYEAKYLERYMKSPQAAVIAVFDPIASRSAPTSQTADGRLIGAATVLPLSDEDQNVKEPFEKNGFKVNEIYYFGESILLSEYRGKGLGHRFFDEREKHALLDPQCRITSFCAVDRPDDHPRRPTHYRSLDNFWKARGYVKAPDLKTSFTWQDIGEKAETAKPLTFWLKNHKDVLPQPKAPSHERKL